MQKTKHWIIVDGPIENYIHKGFNWEGFTVNGQHFSKNSLVGGYNPSSGKDFVSIKNDILNSHRNIKVAYVDKSNPVILRIWVIE